ncbi:MAG: hypothetical protein IJQ59_00755 [Bacteroidaceae bacterium]|nr:hypothetical protein [Bacteroidales bacterium]MBR0272605.1 hypothetical protein [Bacteroidaceae bacterium]
MKKILRKTIVSFAFLWLFFPLSASGQDVDTIEITYMSAKSLCPGYKIDLRLVNNNENLQGIMDSIEHVEPNALPLMSQWCRQQRLRVRQLINSINNDYVREGQIIWLDETHCINDAATVLSRLENVEELLRINADNYDRLEQIRLEEERRLAEERARQEALRIEIERSQRLSNYRDTIRLLNNEILNTCDGRGISDKAKKKELSDIRYAYLAVYNKYELTKENATDNYFRELDELQHFQMQVIDSLLGVNSFSNRFNAFPNKLRIRAGKDHNEVYKSYLNAFKKFHNPVIFASIAEYNEYVKNQQNILYVQQSYLQVIQLRDTIQRNSNTLQIKCSKKHKDVYNSYGNLLGETSLVPRYTDIADADKFVENLHGFITMQHEYTAVVSRLDTIQNRSDSILASCPKVIADVATSYKELLAATDLVPKFINQASADHFNQDLDEFERVQQLYVRIIDIRLNIAKTSDIINSAKGAPKGLTTGYKQMLKYTDFSPHFNTEASGLDFIKLLNHFIEVQNKFQAIITSNITIENNSKKFKQAFKDFKHISKAYERLLKTYDSELQILSEADINSYIQHQEEVLAMQAKFDEISGSIEREQYNIRLKGVKDPNQIKLHMGVN